MDSFPPNDDPISHRCQISRFSSDIAYSRNPAASRASAQVGQTRHQMHFPAPPSTRMPDRVLERKLAARAVATSTKSCEHEISAVAHFADLDLVVREGAEPALPPATHSVVAVQATLHRSYARDRLDVVVHQRQKGIKVAAVDCVVAPIGQLHVLLRYRPRSISRRLLPRQKVGH